MPTPDFAAVANQSRADSSSVWLRGTTFTLPPNRLRNIPIARDPELPASHPEQEITDSRTIEDWIAVVARLLEAAWGDRVEGLPWEFTHEFSQIPSDPNDLKSVIIVWSLVSMVPAKMGSHTEKKPRVREVQQSHGVIAQTPTEARLAPGQVKEGSTWLWAQSFDCCVKFTIYADTYTRKTRTLLNFMQFMQTYASVFIQTGLQSFFIRGCLEENLYDPPKTTPIPNQSILYDVRIEQQTKAHWAVIEQVLITAGILNPVTGSLDDTQLGTIEEGLSDAQILPTSDAV